ARPLLPPLDLGSGGLGLARNREAPATLALCCVHGGIGSMKQVLWIFAMLRKTREAHAHLDVDRLAIQTLHRANCVGDTLADSAANLDRSSRSDNGKFIAAKTSNSVFRSHDGTQTFRNNHQQFVSGPVPHGVVDGFKPVEIEREYRIRA